LFGFGVGFFGGVEVEREGLLIGVGVSARRKLGGVGGGEFGGRVGCGTTFAEELFVNVAVEIG
jgi:hypothetical protein